MNDGNITKVSATEARTSHGQTDWERLRREEAVRSEPLADSDHEGFDWLRAVTL